MIQFLKQKFNSFFKRALNKAVVSEKGNISEILLGVQDEISRQLWERQKTELMRVVFEIQNPKINPPDSFKAEFDLFRRQYLTESPRLPLDWDDRFPCMNDRAASGHFDRHYIGHTGWASRILSKTKPEKHVDIGSSLFFISTVSAFIHTEFYDFRKVNLPLSNLNCGSANLTSLAFDANSIASLSCMHVIEHVGLGRYGDPILPNGDRQAVLELSRVLKPGGNLLIVLPMGRARIEFNAHRVYDLPAAKALLDGLNIKEFTLIPDPHFDELFITSPNADFVARQEYACGCFLLTKN